MKRDVMNRRLLATVFLVVLGGGIRGDEPKDKEQDKKKTAPVVIFVFPPALTRGATTKVEVRGLHLDQTREIRLSIPNAKVEIKEKGKSEPPKGLTAKEVGDTRVIAEIALPESMLDAPLNLIVVTESGESAPRELTIERTIPQVEKEPNDSLRPRRDQTAPPALPLIIDGKIDKNQDVDVFFFSGRAGERVTIEAYAARCGSPLDPLVWVHDSAGRLLADRDDEANSADPRITLTLPADGVYSVSVLNALDRGGALFVYRLRLVDPEEKK